MAVEAAENDGRLARRPLKHAEGEVHAHLKLLLHLDSMIQGHSTAIEVLTPTRATQNSLSLKANIDPNNKYSICTTWLQLFVAFCYFDALCCMISSKLTGVTVISQVPRLHIWSTCIRLEVVM
jgi:hypothetical protein